LSSCRQPRTVKRCHLVDDLSPGSNVYCDRTKLPCVVSTGRRGYAYKRLPVPRLPSQRTAWSGNREPDFEIKATGSCFANQMFYKHCKKSFCTASSFHDLYLEEAVTVEVRSAARASASNVGSVIRTLVHGNARIRIPRACNGVEHG
jgi:hypothetical protein